MRSRLAGAVLGVLGSVGLSVLLWVVFDVPFLFLVIPFVPFLFLRGGGDRGTTDTDPHRDDTAGEVPTRRCPTCGFHTQDPAVRFCPHDGAELRSEHGSGEPDGTE